jgi:hypothetical protein
MECFGTMKKVNICDRIIMEIDSYRSQHARASRIFQFNVKINGIAIIIFTFTVCYILKFLSLAG